MPVIRIDNAGELSKEQKDKLIEAITESVVRITKKPEQYVYVIINEIDRENFGIAGKPLK